MAVGDPLVYPDAPVRLVVLAVGFPESEVSEEHANQLREAVRDQFPLREQLQEQGLLVGLGPAPETRQVVRSIQRFSTRDRQTTMAVTSTSVVIEARSYGGFDAYLDLVRVPIEAVAEVVQPDGVVSIGHRFIDEVHLPVGTSDLSPWFDPALLAMPTLLEEADGWQAVVSYRLGGDSQMTLRYGPIDASVVPAPDGKVRTFSNPVVLLDWDSHWQPSSVPEFRTDAILVRLESMYEPVRSMFRRVCTDELRRTFESDPTGRT